ncbi:hypothetical protein LWI29_010710 [Acer saccharum]|uniref:Reverse transcriptase domain-containing protein n=1 Tax=Acer saccharum TaxID=4024 RepID=A0AA39RXT3_ACESA|nr:hypothetical protein LWI29_010710 [Acer saccharum]
MLRLRIAFLHWALPKTLYKSAVRTAPVERCTDLINLIRSLYERCTGVVQGAVQGALRRAPLCFLVRTEQGRCTEAPYVQPPEWYQSLVSSPWSPGKSPTRLSSTVSLPPPTIQRTQSNKIQDLVEYTHIPASAQINETTLPLLNPYNIFKRSKSLAIRLTRLVHTRPLPIKEYVQSTGLDKCLIPSSSNEQYVTLTIDQDMIDQWIKDGYSHLHIGAVRIILTLHGRKGLPVTARLALLNTIYTQYEHAVIGTCLSTLHDGSISLTYYPNFNIPLQDQNLHKCLKIQVQILGAPMQANSYMATVHHQLAYRLQDHALDLPLPGHNGDTIFIKAEREDEVPTILQIPKQLPREKLIEIMPLEWLTNYEKVFLDEAPVVATDTKYVPQPDGSIKTIYAHLPGSKVPSSSETPPIFQALVIQPVTTEDDIPIHSFEADGSPIYTDKIRGHFIWDVDPNMCDADCICRRYLKDTSPRSYKSWPKPHKPGHPDSPWIGLHPIKKKPLPIYDRALQILLSEGLLPPQLDYATPTLPPPVPCYMTSDYDCDFPPLEPSSNQEKTRFSKPFVQSTEVQPDGSFKQPSQAEQVLNWQSHNARAQNRVLNSIDQKIDRVTRHVSQHDLHLQSLDATFRDLASDLQSRIAKLHSDLHRYISLGYAGPDFDTKEREIQQLKAQLEQLTRDHSREHSSKPKSYSHQSLFFPVSPTHSPPSKPDEFSGHFKSTGELFRKYPVLSSPPAKQKKRSPSKQKDKQAASSSYNPVLLASKVSYSSSKSDSTSEDVSSQSSQTSCQSSWLDTANSSPHDQADLTQVYMASRTDPQPSTQAYESPDETTSTTPTPAPFVEEPPDHVPGRPPAKPTNGPWFTLDDTSPGSWRTRVSEMSAWLDLQLAKSEQNLESILREFVSRFTGSLRDWYQALGEYRQLQFVRVPLASQAMGYIFREFLGDPNHIYKQARQEFFDMRCCSLKWKDIMFHYKRMSQRYHTLGGINDHSLKQVYVNSLPDDLQDEIQRKIDTSRRSINDTSLGELHMYALSSLDKLCATQRFFSKMLTEGKNLQSQCRQPSLQIKCKSSSCTCKTKRKNHFKHFKNKKGSSKRFKFFRKKTKRDIESIFSEQDQTDPSTTFVLQEDISDSESSGSSDYSSVPEAYQAIPLVPQFGPHAPVRIRPDKYSKPVDVIAYLDTGSHNTMMNPTILPPEYWKSQEHHFIAADGKVFATHLISRKKIGIQFFPSFTLWVHVLGTPLPDKDILIGWDIFRQCKSLRILPSGIRYKKNFKAFSEIPKIFKLSAIQAPFEQIQQKLLLLCADNHASFSHPSPLWKNPDFFIKLPFKLNEDSNPTKATHSGMSPSDLKLATEECNELLRQGLIEHTSSPWACQAFYVEKRSELIRGKKRLVVDYKPLNLFLRDDKFPVPRPNVLFSQLPGATVFSKFDLKGAFWQIGIHPDERYKTAFCLPNAQYQWTVLPFGLKTAPSLFQKAVTRIFHPLLHSALIYIDDILLFSPDETSHILLLQQFHDIVNKYDLSVHQIQQFLGIVNYVRDFIPHVSHYTSVLSTLLKKRPPPWGSSHTEAIAKLKKISQSPLALTIPSSGQLILQTDASDIFWGAVLIEDQAGQRSYCGHASGKFKDSQQHYHTIYKEILAVKNGIQKLDFHLRTRNFIVEMDNSSFPKVLDFRNKIPPNPLLLRLKDWFARYDFTVRHVKGHHNIIADMLSRPPLTRPPLTHLITPTGHYPLIYMASHAGPSSSQAGPSSSSPVIQDYSFPPELLANLPPDHQPSLDQIQSFAKAQLPVYLASINSQDCRHTVTNLSRPFLDPFIMPPFYYFSPQLLCSSGVYLFYIIMPLSSLFKLCMVIFMILLNKTLC